VLLARVVAPDKGQLSRTRQLRTRNL
jgi:hypothetical protein